MNGGRARRLAVVGLVVLLLGACGGDDDGGDGAVVPLIDQIEPAVAAVEAELGEGQQYFEVNATPQLVNVFVAGDGGTTATAYVYLDGELQAPAPPQEASGATFAADAIDIDADTVLDRVVEELDDPLISQFVVVGGPDGTARYEAIVASEQGGTLLVVLGADGSVQSVEPL